MHVPRRRRIHPAAKTAPENVVLLEDGKLLTGRLLHNVFVWTEELLPPEEWQCWRPTRPPTTLGGASPQGGRRR